MKKVILSTLLLSVLTFGIATAEAKVAGVDIQTVVAHSSQVQALKKENETKAKELQKWVDTCKKDVEKQKTQAAKDKLAKKYEEQLKKKQEAAKKAYVEKLQAIDKNITDTIVNEAKAKGYELVISKQGAILYSEIDITNDLINAVK